MGDKAAAAAKSSPEWRSDKLEKQGGSRAAQNGDHEGRQSKGDKAAAEHGDHEGKQMKRDKAAAASRPFGDFGDEQHRH